MNRIRIFGVPAWRWPRLIYRAVRHYLEDGGGTNAAAIAYYTLFSLFPLLILILSTASFFAPEEEVEAFLLRVVGQAQPFLAELISANVQQMLRARTQASLISFLGLAWSASNLIARFHNAVNRAWRVDQHRPFWQERLLALATVLILNGVTLVSLTVVTLGESVARLRSRLPFAEQALFALVWHTFTLALYFSLLFVALLVLYKVFPYDTIPWDSAAVGAFVAALLWALTNKAFGWYVARLSPYQLVYGSLGAVVALLVWAYLSALVFIMGAEIGAEHWREKEALRGERMRAGV